MAQLQKEKSNLIADFEALIGKPFKDSKFSNKNNNSVFADSDKVRNEYQELALTIE